MPKSMPISHVPYGQALCLVTLSFIKQAKVALVVGIVMIVSGRASSSFKLDVSYLFCLKAVVIKKHDIHHVSLSIFLPLHKE